MMMATMDEFDDSHSLDLSPYLAAAHETAQKARAKEAALRQVANGDDADKAWFALKTASRHEEAVHNSLVTHGIEAWLPTRKVFHRSKFNRPRIPKTVPAFVSYLFVRMVPTAANWQALRSVNGVYGVLCGAGGPIAIKPESLKQVKGIVSNGLLDESLAKPHWKQGDKVTFTVADGLSYDGVIDGYVGKRAVRVMWSLFGSEQVIEVPLAKIENQSML